MIRAGSVLTAGGNFVTGAHLHEVTIVNRAVVVDRHCRVADFGHLGVNVATAGGSTLCTVVWMRARSPLEYGVQIATERVLAPWEAMEL